MASTAEQPKTHDFAGDEHQHHEFSPILSPEALAKIPTEHSTTSNGAVSHKTSSTLRKTRSALGLHPDAPIAEEDDVHERQQLLWSKVKVVLREPFAEFWGVVIMILFGDGSVAQVLLSTGQTTAPGGNGFGAYQSISWG